MNKIKKLILLMITITGLGVLTGCGETTVDLNKYISITTYGYDTVGRVNCDFNYDQFEQDYAGKIKINEKNAKTEINSYILDYESPEDLLIDYCVDQHINNSYNLSNGDVITLAWDCDDQKAKDYFNVKLNYSDFEYEVQGLEEVSVFDPFEYITVSYNGVAPNGKLKIDVDYSQTGMGGLQFKADKEEGLSNGDEIVITAEYTQYGENRSMDQYVLTYGMIINQLERTYTVNSLPSYVRELSEIPEDMYNKMDQQLQDYFYAHAASSWSDKTLIKELTPIGNYMITLKEGMSGKADNYLYYVYRVTINVDGENDFTYYWYGYYADIMTLEDGTCTVDLSDYVASKSASTLGLTSGDYLRVPDTKNYVAGYADLDSLFNQQVVSKIENYEYQNTVTE